MKRVATNKNRASQVYYIEKILKLLNMLIMSPAFAPYILIQCYFLLKEMKLPAWTIDN